MIKIATKKYKDAFGNVLNVGDVVVFTTGAQGSGLYRGTINKFMDKYAVVDSWDRASYPSTSRPYYGKIVKYFSPKYVSHLQFRDRYLKALEAYGVDSWNGFEYAIHDAEDYLGYKVAEE